MYIIGVFEDSDAKVGKAVAAQSVRHARTVLIDGKNYPRCFNSENTSNDVLIFSYSDIFRFSELCCDILILNKQNNCTGSFGLKSRITVADSGNLRSCSVFCDEIITCGNSPRDTITLSSIRDGKAILSLQREIVSLNGNIRQPREIEALCNDAALPGIMLTIAAAEAMDFTFAGEKICCNSFF